MGDGIWQTWLKILSFLDSVFFHQTHGPQLGVIGVVLVGQEVKEMLI
jgi:hypothetical protein